MDRGDSMGNLGEGGERVSEQGVSHILNIFHVSKDKL